MRKKHPGPGEAAQEPAPPSSSPSCTSRAGPAKRGGARGCSSGAPLSHPRARLGFKRRLGPE
eukprot:15364569-Alexandrium_andersonii.AAC.1